MFLPYVKSTLLLFERGVKDKFSEFLDFFLDLYDIRGNVISIFDSSQHKVKVIQKVILKKRQILPLISQLIL